MKGSLFIGRYAGIGVFIHWTFSILIIWFVGSGIVKGLSTYQILWTILFVLSVFACVTLHEFGHALAARRYGIKTKHITLLPIGGVAQLESMPESPKQELIVAIAGPAVNFVIVAILYPFVYHQSLEPESLANITPGNFLVYLFTINIVLAVFNLIPAFPMDGGRVLRALLSFSFGRAKATRIAATLGQFLAFGFVLLGLFYNPFLVLIGVFIFLGAQSENAMVQSQSVLKGYFVKDVLMREFATINPNDKLSDVAKMLLNSQTTDFVVMENGLFYGILNRSNLLKGISEKGTDALVSQAMTSSYTVLHPDLALDKIYPEMKVKGQSLMPVIENEQLVGVVDTENVMEFILLNESVRASQERY